MEGLLGLDAVLKQINAADKKSQDVAADQMTDLLKSSNEDLKNTNLELIEKEINDAKEKALEGNTGPFAKLIDLIDLKGRERDVFVSKLIADLAETSTPTATLVLDSMNLKKADLIMMILLIAFELQNRALQKVIEELINSNKNLTDEEKTNLLSRAFNIRILGKFSKF